MATKVLLTTATGSATAPAAGTTIATLAAPPAAGLYRITAYTEFASGTLGATEQAGIGTCFVLQDSNGVVISPLPVSSVLGLVTEYDAAVQLDGQTGVKVVSGASPGSAGVVYTVLVKAEYIPNGYPLF